jgi:hypothetical protein
MSDRLPRPIFLAIIILASGCLLAFRNEGQIRQSTVLYDGRLGGTPDQQGLSFIALFTTAANQRFEDDRTMLDTFDVITDQAGYFGPSTLILDRQIGYDVTLSGQVLREAHNNRHRAGFSLLVVSDDLLGLELAFWEDEIWAQEGGSAALFTHAEGVAYDTTAVDTVYELSVLGDEYTLRANDQDILTGQLRDYSAFEGFPDVYESPNLLFLGDNTRSARAETAISYVAVNSLTAATATPLATTTKTPLATPAATRTPRPTATLRPTATSRPSATPTAVPTATIAPSPTPKRGFFWWLPWLR